MLANCPDLSMVSFKNNQIHTVSEQVLSPNIRWLILTNNQIEFLPADIGRLSRLQKLMLAGNRLQNLPKAMANCQNLELIRLSVNRLGALPTWLFQLPRLSWLAYSSYPFCHPGCRIGTALHRGPCLLRSVYARSSRQRKFAPLH